MASPARIEQAAVTAEAALLSSLNLTDLTTDEALDALAQAITRLVRFHGVTGRPSLDEWKGSTPEPSPFEVVAEGSYDRDTDALVLHSVVHVGDATAADILTTSLEGGYSSFEVVDYERDDEHRITSAVLTDAEDPDSDARLLVDADRIRLGVVRFARWVASEDPGCRSYLGQQYLEASADGWDCLDAIGADAVVQFALLGEVVYG